MAKTSPLSAIQELDARIEDQLKHFTTAEDAEAFRVKNGYKVAVYRRDPEEEESEAPAPHRSKGQIAARLGVTGALGSGVAYQNRATLKKGAKKVADAGLAKGSGLLRKGAAGLAGMRKKLHGLEALVDEQLQEFGMDPDDYVGARVQRKKRKRAVTGGVLAAGAVAGGVAAAGKGPAVKRGAMKAGQAVADKAGDALFAGSKAAKKAGMQRTGKALGKGANKAWKGASKLMLQRITTVARGLVELGVR